jgi:DNA-binding TFAR19-related protein (PDSD5 family)
MKEQRNAFMDQLLTPEAKTRLANIAVVKPEKAEKLEGIIIQNA